jgi:hypothetical protein
MHAAAEGSCLRLGAREPETFEEPSPGDHRTGSKLAPTGGLRGEAGRDAPEEQAEAILEESEVRLEKGAENSVGKDKT